MAAQAEERTLPPHARLSAVCAVMRCGRPSERDHPKLGMRLCKHHWLIFFANLRNGFPVADDGSSVLCELCCNESLGTGNELEVEGDALTLTLCDGCKKAWCHDCISSRMGEEYAKQTSEREWKCPYCSPSMRKAFCGDAEFVPLHLSVGQRVAAARQGQYEPRDGIIMCLTAEDPAANDADAAEGEQASLVASILFDDNAWEARPSERVPRRLIFAPHAAATPAAAAKPKVIRDTFIERGAVRKFTVKEAAYTARFLFDSMREDGAAARGEQQQARSLHGGGGEERRAYLRPSTRRRSCANCCDASKTCGDGKAR
ncbi:hypothetical protein AB1Y20_019051 [Prymnesium parvum]|uniref:Zinc-finger domain-containing protein n=1 Tax=Prymnesium parvum TaxID=97485 RepID=A0AB34JT85_PRYPA